MKNKKILIITFILVLVITIFGLSFALYTFNKTSSNSSLVAGDIYMHYNEGNKQISLINAVPSNTYATDYFEFTVDGKNTSGKSINYLISLSYGDTESNKTTRIKDNLLDFKLVSVDNNTETVLIDNINFSSLNGAKLYTESVPSNTNNYLKTYRLYMKISYNTVIGNINEDYTIDEWKDVFASVKVNVSGDFSDKMVASLVKNSSDFKEYVKLQDDTCKTYVEEDGVTYISGTKNCIDFNYVWYSGKLWRITAINNDGTMKMITDDNITNISYNPSGDVNFYDISKKDDTSYTGSYIYQWLNEDFLDTLYNHENIIVMDSTWNITNSNASSSSSISTKLPETTLINNSTIGKNTPVGLLNSYEYYLNYKNTTSLAGYLNIRYFWRLLNPYNSSIVWSINSDGGGNNGDNLLLSFGVRPVIVLKSDIQIAAGNGTINNPYRIVGDKEVVTSDYLNTRVSGEYVIFDEDGKDATKELYRIVSIDGETTKINKNDYIKSGGVVVTKMFGASNVYGSGTNNDYWDYYLNNTWYNSLANNGMIVSSTYYIRQVASGTSYKNSLCSGNNYSLTTKNCPKTTTVWEGYVGLPRYGEMFASQQESGYNSSSTIYLITPYASSYTWMIDHTNYSGVYGPSHTYAVRPSINLDSNVIITGGDGTKSNPFTIMLPK